ncbi:MAG TPA: hypothetical protein VKJ45_17065, partial [Blastocatellia bacterium]|nr:hypothetical protein [Blastocatellia bacterium]
MDNIRSALKSLTMAPALTLIVLTAFCIANAQDSSSDAGASRPAGSTNKSSFRGTLHAVPAGDQPAADGKSRDLTAGPTDPDNKASSNEPSEGEEGGQRRAGARHAGGTRPGIQCARTVSAKVVAIEQAFMLNRLGAAMPQGLIFALQDDVEVVNNTPQLKPYKRARPLVLRVNEGDCLQITFNNWIPVPTGSQVPSTTPDVSLHVEGMQMVTGIDDGGTFVGVNNSGYQSPGGPLNPGPPPPPPPKVYTLYAEKTGTYLLYTLGDTSTTGEQLGQGLFGAVNVEPKGAEWYRSQVTAEDLALAIDKTKGNNGFTPLGQPILNYDAKYPSGPRQGKPILRMTDGDAIAHSDLTAIITGPHHGRFHGITGPNSPDPNCSNPASKADPDFCTNPALPDRKQPFREITTIYHLMQTAVQAFPVFSPNNSAGLSDTIKVGGDNFGINYGTGGIGAEIYANRIGVGPMGGCTDCKFEEFFLSSWAVGDPAMLVDKPANAPCSTTDIGNGTNCVQQGTVTPTRSGTTAPFTITPVQKATVAFYPDDPSNVYHSYVDDHVIFRILHGGTDVTHVHHQHAQQWLQSPNSDNSSYLDSQMISPGASYTLEMVYNGSGNLNKTIGDSIFHCHFYPHFASGMWSLWRVHDVFEAGTPVCSGGYPAGCTGLPDGTPVPGSRALPDGEIANGTPIPAVVPMPTIPMAIPPSPVFVQDHQVVYGTLQN